MSTKKIRQQTLEMQMKYRKCFKNARQHLTALPPIDDDQIEMNRELQKLSNNTGSNFVSTKALRDRVTGRMRMNLVKEYHYNETGIKTLSLELLKSIHSDSNRNSTSLNKNQGNGSPV